MFWKWRSASSEICRLHPLKVSFPLNRTHLFPPFPASASQKRAIVFIVFFPFLWKGQTDSFKEGYKACFQRISALLPQTGLDGETRQRVIQFMQDSMVSATSSCQNCCAHNSRMLHHRLVSLRNNGSSCPAPSSSQQPDAQQAPVDMWRPWWPNARRGNLQGNTTTLYSIYMSL